MTLSVTGSVTYLAASSFSDNCSIEENTRWGSLKPHTTAESFGGLLNCSTSGERLAISRYFEASFNSATNSDPGTFAMWNHFSSFPLVRYRRQGGDVSRESQLS